MIPEGYLMRASGGDSWSGPMCIIKPKKECARLDGGHRETYTGSYTRVAQGLKDAQIITIYIETLKSCPLLTSMLI